MSTNVFEWLRDVGLDMIGDACSEDEDWEMYWAIRKALETKDKIKGACDV